jgi:hypothetical protein
MQFFRGLPNKQGRDLKVCLALRLPWCRAPLSRNDTPPDHLDVECETRSIAALDRSTEDQI